MHKEEHANSLIAKIGVSPSYKFDDSYLAVELALSSPPVFTCCGH